MTKFDKAIFGALTTLLGTLGVAAAQGGVTLAEWLGSVSAALAAFGIVYGVRNQTPLD